MLNDIKKALEIEPWQSLYEPVAPKETKLLDTSTPKAKSKTIDTSSNATKLGFNICTFPESQYKDRAKMMDVSVRKLDQAKNELLNKGHIKEIWFGKSLFLAPTDKLFKTLNLDSPYERDVSDVHSFAVLLTKKLLTPNPLIQSITMEAFLGDSSSTGDLLVRMKNGERHIYEITLSVSNVSANAAKLQNKGFSQIVFVCRDFNMKQAVWAKIRNVGFDPDFLATIRCTIISSLIQQNKKMLLRKSQ